MRERNVTLIRMLIRKILFAAAVVVLGLGLAACGDPTKQYILKKAEGAETKAQLEKAIGKPADVSKLGPVERWTYKAKDGQVVFVVTGDKVALAAAN